MKTNEKNEPKKKNWKLTFDNPSHRVGLILPLSKKHRWNSHARENIYFTTTMENNVAHTLPLIDR